MRDVRKKEFSCDRCRKVLEPNEDIPGWACWDCGVEYRITDVDEDSFTAIAAPLPGFGVCDFCADSNPVWSYPCGDLQTDFILQEEDTGKVVQHDTHHSVDDWAACQACADFIDIGDNRALALHVGMRIATKHGEPERAAEVADQVEDLHAQFLAARKGDPTPIQKGEI